MATLISPRPPSRLAVLMHPARWIRTVGVWQILGGVAAAITWLDLYRRIPAHAVTSDVILLLAVLIALISILLGAGLVKRRPEAVMPSLFLQALQLVGFSTGNFLYQFTLGPYFDVTIVWWHSFAVVAGFQSRLSLRWNLPPSAEAGVAIDLLACFCFWTLLWYEPVPATSVATAGSSNSELTN
ncbi:MAG TPA: hypothetical protein VJW73_23450 [Gemmatimonadaceae bacterium]|nr:hypothetical protein [Gemmatimonadaceae bacterium]